jgi:hypothetical protein
MVITTVQQCPGMTQVIQGNSFKCCFKCNATNEQPHVFHLGLQASPGNPSDVWIQLLHHLAKSAVSKPCCS